MMSILSGAGGPETFLSDFIARARTVLGEVKFEKYEFVVHLHGVDTVQLFARYCEADTYSGKPELQTTRRWNLQPQMSDSEIVFTAVKLVLTSMEHRAREGFTFMGARIASPHFNVYDLVDLCKSGRENAGARPGPEGVPIAEAKS